MKILCAFGRHAYGDPQRGEAYEYVNFLPAMRALGHEVTLFDSFARAAYADFADLNRDFLRQVEALRPDIIFCVLMNYELWRETLAMARASGARLISWGADDSWKYEEFSRFVAPAFDLYATTYRSAFDKAARDGLDNFMLTQWAVPQATLKAPMPAAECRYPVSFIGAAYGNRRRWIADLRRRGIEVACFGHGWDAGPVATEDVPRIINDSVLCLNFGDSALLIRGGGIGHDRQLKARIFEIPGAGGCLLTEPAPRLDEHFIPGEEIETFANPDELAAKIRALLAQPEVRDRIACAGHDRVRREHCYEFRFRQLFDALRRRPAANFAGAARIDWPAFERLAAAHRPGRGLRLLRRLLVCACAPLWGVRRGRRAARRLLFELSWRLCGRATYSATGWPGRLFYRES